MQMDISHKNQKEKKWTMTMDFIDDSVTISIYIFARPGKYSHRNNCVDSLLITTFGLRRKPIRLLFKQKQN